MGKRARTASTSAARAPPPAKAARRAAAPASARGADAAEAADAADKEEEEEEETATKAAGAGSSTSPSSAPSLAPSLAPPSSAASLAPSQAPSQAPSHAPSHTPSPAPVPVRYGRVTTVDAMRLYALSREEVLALPHHDERNRVFGNLTAPTHVFDHAVLRRAAEAKWAAKGTSLAAVLAQRAAAAGKRAATAAEKQAAARAEAERQKAERLAQLTAALEASGQWVSAGTFALGPCKAFLEGREGATLEAAVGARQAKHDLKRRKKEDAKRAQEERKLREKRRDKLAALLARKGGVSLNTVLAYNNTTVPADVVAACADFVEGRNDATLQTAAAAVARYNHDVSTHQRQVAQRRAALESELVRRRIARPAAYSPALQAFFDGTSATITTLAAAVKARAAEAEAEARVAAEQNQNRKELQAALAAHGLSTPPLTDLLAYKMYVDGSITLDSAIATLTAAHILQVHTPYPARTDAAAVAQLRDKYKSARLARNEARRQRAYMERLRYSTAANSDDEYTGRYDDDDDNDVYASDEPDDSGVSFRTYCQTYARKVEAECLQTYEDRVNAGGADVAAAPRCKCGRPLLLSSV